MESDNGRRRGFGPHGEGCECDDYEQNLDNPEAPDDGTPVEPPADEYDGPTRTILSLQDDPNDPIELMFVAISDAYAQHMSDFILYCEHDDVPLNERQTIRLVGSLMRGHASAKSAVGAVQQHLMLQAYRAHAAAMAASEPEPEPEEGHGNRDISELFRETPPSES